MPIHVDHILYIQDIPRECIHDCASSGDVTADVTHWRNRLAFTVDRARTIDCLKGYGGWTREELDSMSDDDLALKVLWLACGDFDGFIAECEDAGFDYMNPPAEFSPNCGSDIFVLE